MSEQDFILHLFDVAERHGQDDEPDHEVGDLQDAIRILIRFVPENQRPAVLDEILKDNPSRLT